MAGRFIEIPAAVSRPMPSGQSRVFLMKFGHCLDLPDGSQRRFPRRGGGEGEPEAPAFALLAPSRARQLGLVTRAPLCRRRARALTGSRLERSHGYETNRQVFGLRAWRARLARDGLALTPAPRLPSLPPSGLGSERPRAARPRYHEVGGRAREDAGERSMRQAESAPMAMADGKLQEWILETIDQLRKRKARPDLERICHMVERRHGIGALQTQAEIERLVDLEVVIKVDYKGNTSYRNAAKWGKKNPLSGQVLNSNDASHLLVEAVRRLEKQTAGADGVHLREVEKYLLAQNAETRLTKSRLQVALEREVTALHLRKLPSGNYCVNEKKCAVPAGSVAVAAAEVLFAAPPAVVLGSPPPPAKVTPLPPPPTPVLVSQPSATLAPSADKPPASPSKKGRPTNKRKRFKKTHGPDFVENYDSSFEEPEPKCDYCLLTSACNYNGKQEDLLFCKDCNAKAHPSCMDYSADLAMRSRMSPWQCMDCKTCFVCDDSGDADSMLFCDACDKGYHMSCHAPKVSEKPIGKWVCWQCTEEIKRKKEMPSQPSAGETMELVEAEQVVNQTIDGAPGLPTPCESPVPEAEQNKTTFSFLLNDKNSCSENKENDEVPDASNWTIEDVENYFKVVGFPEQALAFKDQEIDGKSLLLLKRSDVLTGLSIKLGPALKIYNHVKRLQTRRSDGHLIC